jgi:hypothetical protein
MAGGTSCTDIMYDINTVLDIYVLYKLQMFSLKDSLYGLYI